MQGRPGTDVPVLARDADTDRARRAMWLRDLREGEGAGSGRFTLHRMPAWTVGPPRTAVAERSSDD